jgi:phosphate transport system permease protein
LSSDIVTPPQKLVSGPAPTPAPIFISRAARRATRRYIDLSARLIIQLGGVAVILSILAIFAFLVMEVTPLFFAPTAKQTGAYVTNSLPGLPQPAVVGIDEHQEVAYRLSTDGVSFLSLPTGKALAAEIPEALLRARITAVAQSHGKGNQLAAGTADGRIIPVSIGFTTDFASGIRTITPSVGTLESFQADPTKRQILRLAYQRTDLGTAGVAYTDAGRLWYATTQVTARPDGIESTSVASVELTQQIGGIVTALVLDSRGETISIGTADGRLYHFDVRESSRPVLLGTYTVAPTGSTVTALAYLIGDRSLVIGTSTGDVSVWMPVRLASESNATRLQAIHHFAPHPAAVTDISPSQRDKGFVTTDASGNLYVHYSTSEQTLLRLAGNGEPIQSALFAPKADGVIVLDRTGHLRTYQVHNPHPEVTFASLFLPLWYEGYDQPAQVWQSSGATDDFEAKFGLTPLIFGTLKGTLYALLLAVPLAVLGAIYTAMFMHPDLRARIKPVIEIMAALPTVVLGFLAGLWMAPLLERIFPAIVAMFLVVPLSVIATTVAWQFVPAHMRNRFRPGTELVFMIPVLVGAVALCLTLNQWFESVLFASNYKEWLASVFGVRYDQRNALVVGFAMGFAIIPIIFSISEEALSNVPKNLIAGSLALGATRWQTLARLVFVSASPGIFSALMIGFGRAVGETMIVLMATGNTPIMDWSLFNGFRTLSANIAVEIPEAPHGSTLYRTLFLAALLLFVITFFLNTGAEIIRQRLRKKYSQF